MFMSSKSSPRHIHKTVVAQLKMKSITLEIESNSEIVSLFDKSVKYFFVHRFDPHPIMEWYKADVKLGDGFELKNANVRSMEFDLQTDLYGIKKILELNTNQLGIYQFDKVLPDTLVLEHLPEESKDMILKNNGLKHFFWIDFEFITIESFDSDFIKLIEENPMFAERIIKRKNALQQ